MTFRCAVSGTTLAAHAVRPPRRYLPYASFLVAPTASSTAQQKQQKQQKPFHSTAGLRDEQIDNSRNHYETLKLQPGATPADIKKSFYSLSKSHHPDHNPSNPHASRRFMRISEAYSILSIPAKRAAYDRDTLRLHHPPPSSHPHHRGSYSSTNPAGGRPASGLSRRRGTFQGPPPSFFRSGGWGAHGAKRRAAHDESTGSSSSTSHASSSSTSHTSSAGTGSFGAGGMGPGQTPFGRGAEDDVPHFDRVSHERTGRHIDSRRAVRRAHLDDQYINIEPERSTAGMFLLIGSVLVLSVLGPFAIGRIWNRGSGGGDKKLERKGK
ncbi:DnaJ-domain-containing protein [Daldinia decipiens]|uniref:DnaJ-domain-containing protein n=1 Tax=Daldinia decipiens TaxID=326647 RepID=UPI0020C58E40|nr:DnaJ-domain-containing protein [Daldinia decipiens]KAI1658133.1 DnaJ-domain-containing protein [Daldinia decipiens]